MSTENTRFNTNNLQSGLYEAESAGMAFATSINRALRSVGESILLTERQSESLSDTLRHLYQDIQKVALREALKPLTSGLAGGISNLMQGLLFDRPSSQSKTPALMHNLSSGSLRSSLGSTDGAFARLSGTHATTTASAAVSEKKSASNDSLATTSQRPVSIVLNLHTPNAESFRRSEPQIAEALARAVWQGNRHL